MKKLFLWALSALLTLPAAAQDFVPEASFYGENYWTPDTLGNQMNTGAFMHDLLDWIDNNLDSRLDIETVARRSGYSKWHLQRLFKEHTGYPLAGYIRAQKLQKSVERLSHSDEPILNVAIALGFDSQQSFNRSFKRQYGQAPGAWRRSMGGPETQQLHQ